MASLKDDLASHQVRDTPTDSKTVLQNFAQIDKQTPMYLTQRSGGDDHNAEFMSRVTLGRGTFDFGSDETKKQAEMNAAREAIAELRTDSPNRGKFARLSNLS